MREFKICTFESKEYIKTREQYIVIQPKHPMEFIFIDDNVFQLEVSIIQCSFNAFTILLCARNKLDKRRPSINTTLE